jgi:hypothetical protein
MAATLHDRLAALSDAAVAHRPDAPHARLRSGLQPLLRASYLVAHDEAQHFRSAIERELQSGREWSLTGELTGPWPPYHFVALDAPELQP